MEPTTNQPTARQTKLNVAVDEELHLALKVLSAQTRTPITRLVPELLREAMAAREAG